MGGQLVLLAPLVLLALLQVGVDGGPTCDSNTCGEGAHCTQGSVPVCACLPGYTGNPLTECFRIECVNNNECGGRLTCVNQHCVDPCDGACASNANCNVRQGILVCTCKPRYTGDPYVFCAPIDLGIAGLT